MMRAARSLRRKAGRKYKRQRRTSRAFLIAPNRPWMEHRQDLLAIVKQISVFPVSRCHDIASPTLRRPGERTAF
jgi:hypothetical protein